MGATQEPTRHYVVVCADHHPARVFPGCLIVSPGDTVVFEAQGTDAQLFFPDRKPFRFQPEGKALADDSLPAAVLPLPEDGAVVIGIAGEGGRGCFPYAVYCAKVRAFAIGNSDPTIIIRKRSDY